VVEHATIGDGLMWSCHGGPMDGALVSKRLVKGRLKHGRFRCGITARCWHGAQIWTWCYHCRPELYVRYDISFSMPTRVLYYVGSAERVDAL